MKHGKKRLLFYICLIGLNITLKSQDSMEFYAVSEAIALKNIVNKKPYDTLSLLVCIGGEEEYIDKSKIAFQELIKKIDSKFGDNFIARDFYSIFNNSYFNHYVYSSNFHDVLLNDNTDEHIAATLMAMLAEYYQLEYYIQYIEEIPEFYCEAQGRIKKIDFLPVHIVNRVQENFIYNDSFILEFNHYLYGQGVLSEIEYLNYKSKINEESSWFYFRTNFLSHFLPAGKIKLDKLMGYLYFQNAIKYNISEEYEFSWQQMKKAALLYPEHFGIQYDFLIKATRFSEKEIISSEEAIISLLQFIKTPPPSILLHLLQNLKTKEIDNKKMPLRLNKMDMLMKNLGVQYTEVKNYFYKEILNY